MTSNNVELVPQILSNQNGQLHDNQQSNSEAENDEDNNRCESTCKMFRPDGNIAHCRYFQHHHMPMHNKLMSRFSSIGDQLHKLRLHDKNLTQYRNERIQRQQIDSHKPVGMRMVKSGVESVRLSMHNIRSAEEMLPTSSDGPMNLNGHEMVAATCTRYWGDCETCRLTVHASKYLYCRNCPIVCHNARKCWREIPRDCPAVKLGICGWGEGSLF